MPEGKLSKIIRQIANLIYDCLGDFNARGQLISECLFHFLNFPKTNEKFDKFLPQNLKSSQINKVKSLSYNSNNTIWATYCSKVHLFYDFTTF